MVSTVKRKELLNLHPQGYVKKHSYFLWVVDDSFQVSDFKQEEGVNAQDHSYNNSRTTEIAIYGGFLCARH